jgi:hypothetical protein
MPHVFLSTWRSSQRARFHTSINLHPGIAPAAGNLFKFAHLSGDISSTFGSVDAQLSMMNRAGKLTTESIAKLVSSQ